MPITPYLSGMSFNPETKRVMGVAFEMVCAALRLSDRGDLANEIIAKRIVELAKAGEHNPDLLCEKKCPEGISRAAPIVPPPRKDVLPRLAIFRGNLWYSLVFPQHGGCV